MTEIGETVLVVLKTIGEVLFFIVYGLYCYANLLFRTFVPPSKNSLDGEIFLVLRNSKTNFYRIVKTKSYYAFM
jgi:hypothetical protein